MFTLCFQSTENSSVFNTELLYRIVLCWEEHQKLFHVIFEMAGICHCLRLTCSEGVTDRQTDRLLTRLHNHYNQPTLMTVELRKLTAICRRLLWKLSVWCQVRDKQCLWKQLCKKQNFVLQNRGKEQQEILEMVQMWEGSEGVRDMIEAVLLVCSS